MGKAGEVGMTLAVCTPEEHMCPIVTLTQTLRHTLRWGVVCSVHVEATLLEYTCTIGTRAASRVTCL